jgi:hypothetical protein
MASRPHDAAGREPRSEPCQADDRRTARRFLSGLNARRPCSPFHKRLQATMLRAGARTACTQVRVERRRCLCMSTDGTEAKGVVVVEAVGADA